MVQPNPDPNPYLEDLEERHERETFRGPSLAALAVVHEIRRIAEGLAALTAPRATFAPQEPPSPEEWERAMEEFKRQPIVAIPDESESDRRIAAAARRWAEAYAKRNTTGKAGAYHLASSELAEVVRQENER